MSRDAALSAGQVRDLASERVEVAEKLLESAKSFQKSVNWHKSLDAFTLKKVKQLLAAVDEFVEIFDVELEDGVQAANEHVGGHRALDIALAADGPGAPPVGQPANGSVDGLQQVREVVKFANDVLGGLKNDERLVVDSHSIALHAKNILYVRQVVLAQAAAEGVVQVAKKLGNYRDPKEVVRLRFATKEVFDVLESVLAVGSGPGGGARSGPGDGAGSGPGGGAGSGPGGGAGSGPGGGPGVGPEVEPALVPAPLTDEYIKSEVIKAAEKFRSLTVKGPTVVGLTVEGKQVLLHVVKELRDATNKAQLYANVKTAISLSKEVLDAAQKFKKSVDEKGLAAAYEVPGVGKLQSATNKLLADLNFSAAATKLTSDITVNISSAPDEVEGAARRFDGFLKTALSVGSNEDFRVLVEGIRAHTDRLLLGAKFLGGAQKVLNAAKEFRDLAIQDPRVVDPHKQAEAIEQIRGTAHMVPGPQPKVFRAAKEVYYAADAFQKWASMLTDVTEVNKVEVREKLTKLHEKLQRASRCVDEDRKEYAYTEALNLSLIKLGTVTDRTGVSSPMYPLHKAALEDWEQKDKDLFNKVSRREARSADVTNQIYNIIGWYAVFLGVVLTAVSQLTQTQSDLAKTQSDTSTSTGNKVYPLCGKIKFPFFLTIFGMVATIFGILVKFKNLRSLEKTINTEKRAQVEIERRINTLRRKGPDSFSFTTDVRDDMPDRKPKAFAWGIILVVSALVALALLFILSYYIILCNLGVQLP